MTTNKTIHFTDAIRIDKVPEAFSIMIKPIGPTCNLNCTYCYYLEKNKLYPDTKDFRMSLDTLEIFTKKYIEEQKADHIVFTWQGGEASLLGINFFQKAIEFQKKYAKGKTIENSFQTNGTLLTDEWCEFFHENNFLIGISIDGPEDLHDHYRTYADGKPTFHKVMEGINLLKKHRCEFNTLSVVNDYNSKEALRVYRFLKEIGSTFIQFIPIVERQALDENNKITLVDQTYKGEARITDWSVKPEAYGKFLTTIFDEWVRNDVGKYYVQIFDVTLGNWVGAPPGLCVFAETCGMAAVMEHNGDVYSCDHFVYDDFYIGNIKEQSFGDLFKSEKQFQFGIDKRDTLPFYCKRCEFRFACHGECPKHRVIEAPNGEKGLNYLCEAYKLFFSHVKPYMEYMANELKFQRAPANIMNHIKRKEQVQEKPKLPGRNEPCICGSGKKFKHCCEKKFKA